ncbi:hypothetical protein [Nocardiopsis sp. CC223A]|uniref:hypothetical protein n=1 Tax=Nocardiopsis sp. CC223A TaxID=3044051 RepID=UPI00278C3B0B|nr:hypothetical protein [Nocardiopsis sp. CC223A]
MGRRRAPRLTALASAAVVAVGAVTGCSADAGEPGTAPDTPDAGVSASPAGGGEAGTPEPSGACAQRLVEPDEPIPGEVFAECLVDATRVAQTSRYTTTYPDSSATGPLRMGDTFEVYLTATDGAEVFIRDEQGWMKVPGGGWVEANAGGTPEQVMADAVVQAYLGFTDPRVQEQFFATTEWEPVTADPETVNGLQAIRYSGDPVFGEVTFDSYEIWIDDDYLPTRIVATVTMMGVTQTGQQDYEDWGEPVEMPEAPPS